MFIAALVVRLHWNLEVHPPGDYVYSDMHGYVSRSHHLLRDPWGVREYDAFFPFGTHWMLAGIQWLFGKNNFEIIGIIYAIIGSIGVAQCYAIARRASRHAWVAPLAGSFAVFYYPQLSLGGYILSEIPYSIFLMGALLFALRLVDHGRHRDAWGMGLCAGVGAWFRPQLLLSAAAVGLFWLARRKSMPKLRFVHLIQSAIPLLLCLAAASAHLRHHTGRTGLVSENGSFNLVFGRCHNSKIQSNPDGKGHGRVHFRPPSFLQLNNSENHAKKKGEEPERRLDPAFGDVFSYRGYIGDKEIHKERIKACIEKTGWAKQIAYGVTNAELLWRFNVPWPDSGKRFWRSPSRWWRNLHRDLLAIPALLGLAFIFIPGVRTVKMGLVAVNLLALVLTAAVFFGSIRIRTPYDFIIIVLAFEVYATALVFLADKLRAWRARRR